MVGNNNLYIHPDVEKVLSLHEPVLSGFDYSTSIFGLLDLLSENLYDANRKGDERSFIEAKNFQQQDELVQKDGKIRLSFKSSREIMARQHGYRDWEEVRLSARTLFERDFESAVDFLIHGDLDNLRSLLDEKAHLILQRSNYQHKATLIHYVTANGVEIRRQIVPSNLPEITELLLSKGTEPLSMGFFYGRMMNTEELLTTGTHTRNAGVYEDVLRLIKN